MNEDQVKKECVRQNALVISNAIELVSKTIRNLRTDDVTFNVSGELVTSALLKQAIAARLQRRLASPIRPQ